MNESQEPSYYEIALTNRQVLVAFVVLLLSILGAFVGGVWLGRGGANPAEAGTIAAADEAPSDLDGVEELTFFSEREGNEASDRPRQPGARPAPPSPNNRADDTERPATVDRRAQRDDPVAATPPVAPPRDTTPSQDTTLAQDIGADRAVPPVRQQDTSRPAANDTPVRTAQASPPPTASDRPSPPASGTGFVIQVFSGRDETQARQVLKRLRDDGRGAFLSPVEVGRITMYRVRVGPFGDRARADRAAGEITRKHKLDTWITAAQ